MVSDEDSSESLSEHVLVLLSSLEADPYSGNSNIREGNRLAFFTFPNEIFLSKLTAIFVMAVGNVDPYSKIIRTGLVQNAPFG